ncbi:UDP-3-O-(3-hydroxymyristoyl)glucosamine N-acyltransferase [Psychromarinibacter sp. S121]|uniref:UDP-3-O-(3-hydroxymyristoyl)glucosamine N-acyltransferase n=1 Tax=Psychromarinibacter sp. S121 TaxID=3415127 RepID=UPI003C7B1048
MPFTIAEIAAGLGAKAHGKLDLVIRGVAEPALSGPDDLALAMAPKYAAELETGKARAAILWQGVEWEALGLDAAIIVDRARVAMARLTSMLDKGPRFRSGIHASAVIDETAEIGPGASIGAFVLIGPNVRIGSGARIDGHVTIGADTVIGDDPILHSGVRFGPGVRAGDRLIAHQNAVIGSDGFSFVTPEAAAAETARETMANTVEAQAQSWLRIHSLGTVEIGDDVEIGAGTTIDRGTIRATRIGRGTKIDNQVQIGHNVEIGEDCLLCGQAGVAGSAKIGDHVVLGGDVSVADNVTVGPCSVITGASKVASNVPAGRVMAGYPAVQMKTHVESYKALRRLPRLFREVNLLKTTLTNRDE